MQVGRAGPSFERLGELTRRALRKSFDGRPGVVHLDVPENIFNGDVTLPEDAVWEPSAYRNTARLVPSQDQVERAAQLLIEAEKPVIHAGSGVLWADATAELDRVARLLHAPVTTSWAGRAAVKETEGYSIPLLYLDLVNQTRVESDAVLILGSRVGETDWWGKQPYWGDPHAQKTIQVDIDAETIGVNKPVVLGVQACAKTFLAALADVLERRKAEIDTETRRARIQKIQDARAKARAKLDKKLKDTGSPMGSAHVNTICQQVLGDDAIAVFDGGNTAVWGHFFHEVRTPGALLSTFKMGHLGAGTPQALGAKAAFPNRHVYCMTGDGAMGMQLQEIETAVRNRLNVIYLVLSDKQWGMVKINQQFALRPIKTLIKGTLDEHETINTDLCEIDFARAAQAMGANGERVSDPVALKAAVERAARANGPTVIHVDVDPVKHMWAPGLKAFKDMHLEPKGK